ncbi:hypothetical protein D3C86_2247730 [compost metagenome]
MMAGKSWASPMLPANTTVNTDGSGWINAQGLSIGTEKSSSAQLGKYTNRSLSILRVQ